MSSVIKKASGLQGIQASNSYKSLSDVDSLSSQLSMTDVLSVSEKSYGEE